MTVPTAPGPSMGDRMIFVVGARRSGTNWIGRIIGTHPDVASVTSESFLFYNLSELTTRFQHGSKGSWQLATIYLDREVLVDALREFCDRVFSTVLEESEGRATRLLERTPDHWRYLELIGEIYPHAQVVHIIRDGRDVARSLVSMEWGPDTLTEAAQEWVDSVEQGGAQGAGLRHYTQVRYEELLADPRGGVTDLFDRLALPVTPTLVEEVLTEAGVAYNHDPAMPNVVARKWATALTAGQIHEIELVAGDTLSRLGYDRAEPGGAPSSLTARASRLASGARRAVRRRPASAADPAPTIIDAQMALDTFLAHARAGRTEEALALVDDRARVQLVGGDEHWEGRGGDAPARLVDALVRDPAVTGRQARSDVWPSAPAFTVVFAGEHDPRLRTLVVYLEGERVVRAAYYSPDVPGPPGS